MFINSIPSLQISKYVYGFWLIKSNNASKCEVDTRSSEVVDLMQIHRKLYQQSLRKL